MAHDPHATALIKALKETRKHFQDLEQPYYTKFIKEGKVPTEEDIKHFTALLAQIEAASKLMHSDLNEVEQALAGFGGSGDTVLGGLRIRLNTMKKKVQHH